MNRKLICLLTGVILAICLISSGCEQSSIRQESLKTWRDLLNPISQNLTSNKATVESEKTQVKPTIENSNETAETVQVKLFFFDSNKNALQAENAAIVKTEGIARSTMERLLLGPSSASLKSIAPFGTHLLDINIKKNEQLCIVDLSSEAKNISDKSQAKMMVDAISNTLFQFPSVKKVSILIAGESIEEIPVFADSESATLKL